MEEGILVAWAADLSLGRFHSEGTLVPGETEEALFKFCGPSHLSRL